MKRLLLLCCFPLVVFASEPPPVPSTPGFGQPGLRPPLPEGVVPSDSPGVPAAPLGPLTLNPGAHVDLRFTPVAQVVDLIYAEMLHQPYVLAPEVLADNRNVSFRYERSQGDVRAFMVGFLGSLGYRVDTRDGVDYVTKRKEDKDDDAARPEQESFVYRPKYRSADYLSRLTQPMVKGRFVQNKAIPAQQGAKVQSDVPPTSAAGLVDQGADVLVFLGSEKEIGVLKKVLPQLDTPAGQVVVRAWVYEVTTDAEKQTGFQLAATVLGGQVGISFGVGSVSGLNTLTVSAGSLSAAIAALDSDSRFHIVTSPNIRVESGKHARLNVGQSVPVVSSVSYPTAAAAPVQSVVYEDAGVIFDVQPTVRDDVIDTEVTVEISDFQKTTTGVNNSPTKNTRKSETTMGLSDGEVIVMGGLSQGNEGLIRTGVSWLPRFMNAHTISNVKSDVVLVLQVNKM